MATTTWGRPFGWRVDTVTSENGRTERTLTFSLETLIRVAVYSVGIGAGMFVSTASIRSDVRNIVTTLEMQSRLEEMKAQRNDERMTNLRTTIDDLKRRLELTQYEVQGLKEQLLKGGGSK